MERRTAALTTHIEALRCIYACIHTCIFTYMHTLQQELNARLELEEAAYVERRTAALKTHIEALQLKFKFNLMHRAFRSLANARKDRLHGEHVVKHCREHTHARVCMRTWINVFENKRHANRYVFCAFVCVCVCVCACVPFLN